MRMVLKCKHHENVLENQQQSHDCTTMSQDLHFQGAQQFNLVFEDLRLGHQGFSGQRRI